MNITVITSAPKMIKSCIDSTILRKAVSGDHVDFHLIDIRDFADNDYKQIDDTPFGGGEGMVLMAEPLMRSIEHSFDLMSSSIENTNIIYPTPQGRQWNQEQAENNVHIKNFIFICGRYKGVDQRVIDKYQITNIEKSSLSKYNLYAKMSKAYPNAEKIMKKIDEFLLNSNNTLKSNSVDSD